MFAARGSLHMYHWKTCLTLQDNDCGWCSHGRSFKILKGFFL